MKNKIIYGDPHWGNFIIKKTDDKPIIYIIDFGLCSHLTEEEGLCINNLLQFHKSKHKWIEGISFALKQSYEDIDVNTKNKMFNLHSKLCECILVDEFKFNDEYIKQLNKNIITLSKLKVKHFVILCFKAFSSLFSMFAKCDITLNLKIIYDIFDQNLSN